MKCEDTPRLGFEWARHVWNELQEGNAVSYDLVSLYLQEPLNEERLGPYVQPFP